MSETHAGKPSAGSHSQSFGRRLQMVLLTYVTRPLIWLLVLAGVLLCLFQLTAQNNSETCSPQVLVDSRQVRSPEDLRSKIASGESEWITDVWFSHLLLQAREEERRPRPGVLSREELATKNDFPVEQISPGAKELMAQLERLPRLARIKYDPMQGVCPLELVGRLTQARELELRCQELGVSLKTLASLRNLERLEFSRGSSLPSLAPLAELPRLNTLIFPLDAQLTDSVVAEIAQLRQLKVIVLPDCSPYQNKPEALAPLRSLPKLTDVYVKCQPGDVKQIDAVRQALPEITVHFGQYDSLRVLSFAYGCFAMLFVTSVFWQGAGQFSLPQSKLMPNYANPHRVGAFSVPALAVVAVTVIIAKRGGDWLPAAIAFSLSFLLMAWCALVTMTEQFVRRRPRLLTAISAAGPLSVFFMLYSFRFWAGDAEMYLHSQYPRVACGLLIACMLLAGDCWRRLPRCHDCLAEAGIPPSFGFRDQQAAATATLNDPNSLAARRLPAQDRRLSQTLMGEGHLRSAWQRIRLWRAAIQKPPVGIFLLAFASFTFASQVLYTTSWQSLLFDSHFWSSIVFMLPMFVGAMVLGVWWRAYGVICTASVWPVTRREMTRDIFCAVAGDLLVLTPIIVLGAVGVLHWTRHWPIAEALAVAILGTLAAVAVLHSIGVWAIPVRRFWALVAAFILLEFAVMGLSFTLVLLGGRFVHVEAVELAVEHIVVIELAICLVAALSTWFAWRHWMRLEFGKV